MKLNARSIALCAVLTALALGLSTLENLFPVTLIVPLPGVKLGLANIVTVFALYELGAVPALTILAARCLLGGLFAGNLSALLFSLLGGFTAMLVMIALKHCKGLSIYGVSIGGAAAHNLGQMAECTQCCASSCPSERFFRVVVGGRGLSTTTACHPHLSTKHRSSRIVRFPHFPSHISHVAFLPSSHKRHNGRNNPHRNKCGKKAQSGR